MTPEGIKRALEKVRDLYQVQTRRGEERHFGVDEIWEWATEFDDVETNQWASDVLDGKFKDDPIEHARVCAVASCRIDFNLGLPEVLGRYVSSVLTRECAGLIAPTKVGRRSRPVHDYWIVVCVKELLREYPSLNPTRNPATKKESLEPSACSLVAQALDTKERTVEDIWRDRELIMRGRRRRQRKRGKAVRRNPRE